jgi:hypothetical protein
VCVCVCVVADFDSLQNADSAAHSTGLLRSSILSAAVTYRYKPALETAVSKFWEFIETKNRV